MSAAESIPNLEGRVAIVTGGASGIGRATCEALCLAGASVVVSDLNAEGAEQVAEGLRNGGAEAIGVETDVGDEDSIAAMVDAAVSRFGRLDILHNNAADSDPALMGRDLTVTEMDVAVWDRTMRVNLRGPMLGCKHAIPHMVAAGGGAIVNTSSASGLTGDASRSAYAASKAGLRSLTESVAAQYGKQGVRSNAIAPGVISTPALAANVPADQIEVYAENTLTTRLGRPEDIAAAVVFLASDAAAFITGQVISVDGGLLAHHPTMAELQKRIGSAQEESS